MKQWQALSAEADVTRAPDRTRRVDRPKRLCVMRVARLPAPPDLFGAQCGPL
jgi:hypothetical protein